MKKNEIYTDEQRTYILKKFVQTFLPKVPKYHRNMANELHHVSTTTTRLMKRLFGLHTDFAEMSAIFQSMGYAFFTREGVYNPKTQRVNDVLLTPEASTFMVDLMGEPFFIGCRQLCDAAYQARPLYAIYNNTLKPRLRLTLTRQFHEDRERLYLEEVTDEQGNMMKRDSVTVMLQSIADDGNYWLDKGEFTLGIGESLKD